MREHAMVVSLCVVALAGPQLSQAAGQSDKQAKAEYNRGRKLSAEGKFDEALAAFSRGYELSHLPIFLFNMGECARALGDVERARDYYERYLAAEPRGQAADLARDRLAAMPPAPEPQPEPTPQPEVKPEIKPEPQPQPQPARPDLTVKQPEPPPPAEKVVIPPPAEQRSVWKSPWLWAGVGAAVVAGTIIVFAATRDDGFSCSPPACQDAR